MTSQGLRRATAISRASRTSSERQWVAMAHPTILQLKALLPSVSKDEHSGEVADTSGRGHVSDVRHPEPVRGGSREVAADEVGSRARLPIPPCRDRPTAPMAGSDDRGEAKAPTADLGLTATERDELVRLRREKARGRLPARGVAAAATTRARRSWL